MSEQAPEDPISIMAESATAQHEIFLTYIEAGFTRPEALQIVIAMITTHIAMPSVEE